MIRKENYQGICATTLKGCRKTVMFHRPSDEELQKISLIFKDMKYRNPGNGKAHHEKLVELVSKSKS